MQILKLFAVLLTAESFAIFRRQRFTRVENDRHYIREAIAQLKSGHCEIIARSLSQDLFNNVWQKCSIFRNCEEIILDRINEAKKMCRMLQSVSLEDEAFMLS